MRRIVFSLSLIDHDSFSLRAHFRHQLIWMFGRKRPRGEMDRWGGGNVEARGVGCEGYDRVRDEDRQVQHEVAEGVNA